MVSAIDTNYSATFDPANYVPTVGDCVCLSPNGRGYVLATDAAMAARAGATVDGVVIVAGTVNFLRQASGYMNAAQTGLGPGARSLVRRGSNGHLQRAAFDTVSDFLGECDGDGNMTFGRVSRTTTLPLTSITVTGGDLSPEQFGAVGDGIHNDLPAFQALIASIAIGSGARIKYRPVSYFLGGSWFINRLVHHIGNAGAYLNGGTELLFPAGCGMYHDNAAISLARGGDGGSADGSKRFDLRVRSVQMMWFAANGSNPGFGSLASEAIGGAVANPCGGQRVDATFYALGTVMARGAATNAVCFFEAIVGGTSAGTVPGAVTSEPAGFAGTTAGVTFTDGGVTWIARKFPQDYIVPHAYTVGDRVLIPGQAAYYFECIHAGTSSLSATDTSWFQPPFFAGASPAQEQFADGALVWAIKTHSPNIVTCLEFEEYTSYNRGFTTMAVDLSTPGTPPIANSDFAVHDSTKWFCCGGGVLLQGFNANGIRVRNPRDYYMATGRNARDTTTFGCGGYLVWDRGLQNEISGGYAQDRIGGGAGPAYFSDGASAATFIDADSERVNPATGGGFGDIFNGSGGNIIVRPSFAGINYAASSPSLKEVGPRSRNKLEYQWRITTTTATVFQTLFIVPAIPNNSAVRLDVLVEGKRTGNHSSFLSAACVAHRGINNAGAQESGTDAWTVTTWGAENGLAGQTFDINPSASANVIRVDAPPAYSVDWTITVVVTGLA